MKLNLEKAKLEEGHTISAGAPNPEPFPRVMGAYDMISRKNQELTTSVNQLLAQIRLLNAELKSANDEIRRLRGLTS